MFTCASISPELSKAKSPTYRRVCVCSYTYMYIYKHICIYVCIYIYTYIHIHTYMYIHTHLCIYVRIYIYIHLYTYAYIHTYVYIYKNIHIYIYTYIYIDMFTCASISPELSNTKSPAYRRFSSSLSSWDVTSALERLAAVTNDSTTIGTNVSGFARIHSIASRFKIQNQNKKSQKSVQS